MAKKKDTNRFGLWLLAAWALLSGLGMLHTWDADSWPWFVKVAVWLVTPIFLFIPVALIVKWQSYQAAYRELYGEDCEKKKPWPKPDRGLSPRVRAKYFKKKPGED